MLNLKSLQRKLGRSLKRYGVLGTMKKCFLEPYHMILEYKPSRILWRKRDKEFDRRFGVDTAGTIALSALDIDNEHWEYGFAYQPTDPKFFKTIVGELPIAFEEFTFVDVGSGKGRVLLLATEFPFQKILGVEIAEGLHEIAKQNIRNYRNAAATVMCRDVQTVCADAAGYELPNDPCVLYFFNPFQEEIMSKVLANIQRSLQAAPRNIFIVYRTPLLSPLLDGATFLTKIRAEHGYAVYSSVNSPYDSE
jgi:SAM-dependent methyltransferase